MRTKNADKLLEGCIAWVDEYNFENKIYNSTMPCLLIVYNWEDCVTYHRDAIIFRELSKKYSDKINFFAYKDSGTFISTDFIVLQTRITALPSIILLSKKDLLTGKTSEKNFVIDILRGGPISDEYAKQWVRDIPVYWINRIYLPL